MAYKLKRAATALDLSILCTPANGLPTGVEELPVAPMPPVAIRVAVAEGVFNCGQHNGVKLCVTVVVVGVRRRIAIIDAPADLLTPLYDMNFDGDVCGFGALRSIIIKLDILSSTTL
jgi:hypothetical protein